MICSPLLTWHDDPNWINLKVKVKRKGCFWRYKSQFGELDLAWWPKLDTTWEEEEIGQIYFTIWTNTSINLDKYKNQSGQIQKSIWRLGSGVMTQTRHDVRRRGNWKVSRLKLELDDSAENKRHFSEEKKKSLKPICLDFSFYLSLYVRLSGVKGNIQKLR